MQTTIINVITKGLEDHLKTIDSKDITKKIVTANVKNFKDLLSERGDKSLTNAYKDLLDFAKICKAKKGVGVGGKPKRKKYTRKSHNKPNKQKTRRFKGGNNECLNVGAICGKVTSIINSQAEKFETETVNEFNDSKLKTKLEEVCRSKTHEILDDFSKQAIDISSLDDIFKMLIFEITNIVTSNMKNLDETICKSDNDS
jgi:Ni,Fe-hydrogenase I large subunit